MQTFSPQISSFLKKAGLDQLKDIAMVPKTKSCGSLGDFLIFRYVLGVGSGSRAQRMGMIVRPIIKLPGTGHYLLTVVKVPLDKTFSTEDLINLYKNRSTLPTDNYRTYILNKIYGPLFRLRVK